MPTNPPRPHLDKIMRAVATLIRSAADDALGDDLKTIALDAKHAAAALQAENERLRRHAEELQVALDEATGGSKE
jgi:hypothetical protein